MIRPATSDDLLTLLALERAASSTGLAHIFGPDIPFPAVDVLARWRLVLDEPGMTTVVAEEEGEPAGYAAFGNGWLQHLGVLPDRWGRGLGRTLHDHALSGLREADPTRRKASLWVLVENHRARRFYTRLGWVDSGDRDHEGFPPYPQKMRMVIAFGGPAGPELG